MSKEERFKAHISTNLVLIKDNKVLLLKRANTDYQNGNYCFVGGHLDGGETAKQAIVREAKEEAGIDLNLAELKIINMVHHLETPEKEYFHFFFTIDTWKGDIKNMEPEKHDELKWFPLDELPNNIVPETKITLKNMKKNISYGEIGWDD